MGDFFKDIAGGVEKAQAGFLGPTYNASFGLPDTVRIPQIARDIMRTDPLECRA